MKEASCYQCQQLWQKDELLQGEDNGEWVCADVLGPVGQRRFQLRVRCNRLRLFYSVCSKANKFTEESNKEEGQ